jgi:hypothetical protein
MDNGSGGDVAREIAARLTDDHSLILACQRGNLGACARLVTHHEPEVLRTAFLLTNDPAQAARLATQAFEDAFRRLASIDNGEDLRAQLLSSLARTLLTDQPGMNRPYSRSIPHPAGST